jgi:hypothetical protein
MKRKRCNCVLRNMIIKSSNVGVSLTRDGVKENCMQEVDQKT